MNILIVPRVVKNYISNFPETTRNAYKYFNYDNRVVEERVDRHDAPQVPYKGPNDITNADYENLVMYAKTLVNPILMNHSPKTACEDALHMAIGSFSKGSFSGKIDASKFEVLLKDMISESVTAKEKKKKTEKPVVVKPHTLKELGLTPHKIPRTERVRNRLQKGVPLIVREEGKIVRK